MDVYTIAAILVPLSKGFGASMAAMGLVFMFQAIGQIIGSYLVAPYADKVGRRPLIMWCTLGFGVMTISCAFAPTLEVFIALRTVAFILIGTEVPCIFSIVSEFASGKNRHRNVLVVGSFHGIGAGLAGLVGGFLLQYGWHVPLICVGILDLLSVIMAYFFMPESIRFLAADAKRKDEFQRLIARIDPTIDPQSVKLETVEGQAEKAGVASLFTNGRWHVTLLLWVVGGICISMLGAAAQWAPTLFHTYGGVDLKNAAFMLSLNGPAGIIWPFALIFIMNKMGVSRAMAFNYALAAIALSSLAFFPYYPLLGWVFAMGVGAFLGGATSGFYALCAATYSTLVRATGTSWAVGAGRVLSMFVPPLIGLAVSKNVSAGVLATALVVPMVIAIIATLALGRLLSRGSRSAAEMERRDL